MKKGISPVYERRHLWDGEVVAGWVDRWKVGKGDGGWMAVLTLSEQQNQGRAMARVDSVLGLAYTVHSLLSTVLGLAYIVSRRCPLSPVHWDSCL